ncbi:hypothetical protein MKX01_027255 [Papaver californicum]|nr:hypothetical protein MKX01_027255 [Papaver californicum]
MTNEIEERKTISVEFAMQRELDYCKKIEEMKKELPGYNYEELSMPVQGEPSNFELREIDRRSPSHSFSKTQGEMSDLILCAKKIMKEEIRDEMYIAEMANESVKGNIRPVEFAIQRELAYQKKIEAMQLQPRYDLVELVRKFSTELPVAYQETHSILEPMEMNTIPTSDKFPCFEDHATTEKVMWKTMSVELALQREIEYQEKIKRLNLQAGNDFGNSPAYHPDLELRKMNRESCFGNGSSLQGGIWNSILFPGEVQHEKSQQEITRREMSNERDRTTTMPVELSIQWELEFQRKMQDLQSGFKIQELPIPHLLFLFQESTPDQKTAKVKETAPFADLAYPLSQKVKQHIYQKNPLYCKDCGVLCSGAKALKIHYRGKRHVNVVMLKRKNNATGGRELVCEVCLVAFTDKDSLLGLSTDVNGMDIGSAVSDNIRRTFNLHIRFRFVKIIGYPIISDKYPINL